MDIIAIFFALLAQEEMKSFFAQYVAGKALDFGMDKAIDALKRRPEPLEEELLTALNGSLLDTCDHFGWEYDERAILETFVSAYQEAWNSVADFASTENYRRILSNAVGCDVDEKAFEYWCYSINNYITDDRHEHLYRYMINLKINFIRKEMERLEVTIRTNRENEKPLYKEEESIVTDTGLELMKKFDDLFLRNNLAEKNAKAAEPVYGSEEWIKSASPQERIQFEDIMQHLYFQKYGYRSDVRSVMNNAVWDKPTDKIPEQAADEQIEGSAENSDRSDDSAGGGVHGSEKSERPVDSQKADKPNEDETCCGTYFSLYESEGETIVIYMVSRVALPELHKWMPYPERLESVVEYMDFSEDRDEQRYEPGAKKRTFFIENPSPEGNCLVILTFTNQGRVLINAGFSENKQVKISKKPMDLPTSKQTNRSIGFLSEHDLKDFGWEIKEKVQGPRENVFEHTIYPDRRIVVIDVETIDEVKAYFENRKDAKAKLKVSSGKIYLAFEIRLRGNHSMSDFDIGCAYKYGRYRLKRNYEKAFYYLRLAEAGGDKRASEELAVMYEKGIGTNPKE